MIYCRSCGKILEEEKERCPFCGHKEEEEGIGEQERRPKSTPVEGHVFEQDLIEATQNRGSGIPDGMQSIEKVDIPMMSNWRKVLLSIWVAVIPGIGPLMGMIIGSVLMTGQDEDRKSFGQALLGVSVFFLLLLCGFCFMMVSITQYAGEQIQRLLYNLQR